ARGLRLRRGDRGDHRLHAAARPPLRPRPAALGKGKGLKDASKGAAYDVAVIGGGLVGSAIAWGLARLGARVVVLDEGDIALRASRGNFALVWVQNKGNGLAPYGAWTLDSAQAWPGFAQ